MTFQNPQFLWLLLLLLVPLLLYLLPMPRWRAVTSALFLWERFLQSERVGRTTERFRRALGFALFLAILASLILAAAGPVIGKPPTQARRLVVLLDASASMNAVRDGRGNLDRAKAAAGGLIESLDSTTEVAIVEAAGELRVVAPFEPATRRLARDVRQIEPFDGSTDLARSLERAHELWGGDTDVQLHAFTDMPLPQNPWGDRARAWVAPPAGDNIGIVALRAQRRGRDILARFTLANYSRERRTLGGSVLLNGLPRESFAGITLQPGEQAETAIRLATPEAAALQVRLDTTGDALGADDAAYACVPSLEDLAVRVVRPAGSKGNAYVNAVLSALQDEGSVGPVAAAPGKAAATVFVDHMPVAWPEGGAIVLYPLRSGVMEVQGLHKEPLSISSQAEHALLRDVNLRGIEVKGAAQVRVPEWGEPLVWAGDLPVIWAGATGKSKVLLVGIPPTPAGSRFPLAASFPALMRNAFAWMLPSPEVRRPGDPIEGWTSRRVGLVESPLDGAVHAFSALSAAESDLRRQQGVAHEPTARRHSLASVLVALAILLLPVEWGLFHKRLTE